MAPTVTVMPAEPPSSTPAAYVPAGIRASPRPWIRMAVPRSIAMASPAVRHLSIPAAPAQAGPQASNPSSIRRFVNPVPDCNGDLGGSAFIDSCGICSEGNTGRTAVLDPEACNPPVDCNGDENGSAFSDSCGVCAAGNTGITPILDPEACNPPVDCNGEENGTAFIDSCGTCAGGTTGVDPVLDPDVCNPVPDCNGDPGGSAFVDSCGNCAGGNTGITPVLDSATCKDFIPGQSTNGPFAVYPNPNNGTIHVTSQKPGEFRLRIFSVSGNILSDRKLQGDADIDTSALPPGYYEVVIESKSGIYRMKMIRL